MQMSVFPDTEVQRMRTIYDAYKWHLTHNYILYLGKSTRNRFELWARNQKGKEHGNICLGLLVPAGIRNDRSSS
ncbi:hypothetical protein LCGC14_1869700 [marine sediment metagenome]|uniref:Uncharacterized protein n=1 Tax=marine sediment metagenome TaxID=412755 RepID=A0A0F9G5F6_9ZZZZ